MKRSADEECPESQSGVKKIRTDLDTSTSSESSLTGSSLLPMPNLPQAKDGTVEEIRVTNFMSFTSHKFRLVL